MEIYHLSRILYRGYMKDNNYNQYKRSASSLDTQSKLQEIMNNYKDHYQKGDIETITLNTAFLIDFLKLSPFKAGNYAIGFIYFYALNITQNINCFKYNSFFEYIKNNYNELESAINSAFYQYEDDLSNPSKLIKFMLKACKESFIKLHSDISINDFDKKSSKAILIKRAILSFKESFTKEDIRNKVLGASDSTIERVLKELQSENIIMTTGTGRSAKWVIIKSDFNLENQNIDFSL